MAQPQPQAVRPFSPPQALQSPAPPQTGFALPPMKRPRLSPHPPSRPDSPFLAPQPPGSPPVSTPTMANTPMANAPMANTPNIFSAWNTPVAPHTNGQSVSGGLSLPTTRPLGTPPTISPNLPSLYKNATLSPILAHPTTFAAPFPAGTGSVGPGVMGPPTKPVEKATKEYQYDVTDSLAGTGIDIRAEEQLLTEMNWNSLEAPMPDARTGFALGTPGNRASFYGAGIANQPTHPDDPDATKAEVAAQNAERIWNEAAMRLALARVQEITTPFLSVAAVHQRATKISRDHGISLNLDLKNSASMMGRMRPPSDFPAPTVTVKTVRAGSEPDAAVINTYGSWIPHDAFLVDQIALLSLATKQRLRDLLEDAHRVARNRQATSHGYVPEEWIVAAGPLHTIHETEPGCAVGGADGDRPIEVRTGLESAVSPHTNPLKRLADGTTTSDRTAKALKVSSSLATTMRDIGRAEREWEEARLRRRNKTKEGTAEANTGGAASSRAASIAPSTPSAAAADPADKTLNRKEQKRSQSVKAPDATASHANQNTTSSMFAGLLSVGSLFGKNKGKGKSYDWMTAGKAGGSGTATPTRLGPAGSGATGLGLGLASAPVGSTALTAEGRNRLGTWREDREKGRHVQLRDWVAALEADGMEIMALQEAYDKLDASYPS